jgi:outer membrane protein OmpA-like peptidoglycan-associated protein
MKIAYTRMGWTIGLLSVNMLAAAGEATQAVPPPAPLKSTPPQEPAGFIAGGVIGGLAAGPLGAVIGAGVGTWLGNRVHRAGDASKAGSQVVALQSDKAQLQGEKSVLLTRTSDLSETNRALTSRLDQLSHSVEAAQSARDAIAQDDSAKILDGLQGDVLFRTGSADITPEMARGIQVLAEAVAKSPALRVRVDGYADSRGSVATNLELSKQRADAVRDLFLAAGVTDEALEVNAYGKSQSVADDNDGYALERRVRLTLQAEAVAVAQTSKTPTEGGAETGPMNGNE